MVSDTGAVNGIFCASYATWLTISSFNPAEKTSFATPKVSVTVPILNPFPVTDAFVIASLDSESITFIITIFCELELMAYKNATINKHFLFIG